MVERHLVLDTNYLAWRAHYSKPELTHQGKPTGAIYGVLQDVVSLQALFDTSHFVFCFDRGRSLRANEYAPYKQNRQHDKLTKEQRLQRKAVRQQLQALRTEVLPSIGFCNVFSHYGYEADDIIASVASTLATAKQEVVIVGSDKDLYQLLSPRISIYNPRTSKTLTYEAFLKQYGINPTQWIDVKSISGCPTDNVKGIKYQGTKGERGVGEATALAFLCGRLKEHTKAFQAIVKGNDVWQRNRKLVELPYEGTPEYVLREDKVTEQRWRKVVQAYGMRSLAAHAPIRNKDVRKRLIKKREIPWYEPERED